MSRDSRPTAAGEASVRSTAMVVRSGSAFETSRGLGALSRPAGVHCGTTEGSGVPLSFWCCAADAPPMKASSWATATGSYAAS
jgi:hypothetical protein